MKWTLPKRSKQAKSTSRIAFLQCHSQFCQMHILRAQFSRFSNRINLRGLTEIHTKKPSQTVSFSATLDTDILIWQQHENVTVCCSHLEQCGRFNPHMYILPAATHAEIKITLLLYSFVSCFFMWGSRRQKNLFTFEEDQLEKG